MQIAAGRVIDETMESGRSRSPIRVDVLVLVTMLALLVGFANRAATGWQAPLWFDETFSAVIASQRQGPQLWEWLTHEISGPVYYVLLWMWEKLAGNSNVALRIPGFIASVAAPLFILWRGHPDRRTRLIWASLLALSTSAFAQATEARSYALLILLTTLQASAFLRLLDAPDTRRAALWVSISGLCVLTHYHAIVISGLQGLAYLGYWRVRALKTWPAILLLIPVAAWMAVHVPFVMAYATSGETWYQPIPVSQIIYLPFLFLDYPGMGLPMLVGILATLVISPFRKDIARQFRLSAPEALTVSSAAVAIVLVFLAGCASASFTPRYATPFVPAILLGVGLWLARMDRLYAKASTIALAIMVTVAIAQLREALIGSDGNGRYVLNLEQPSDWIRQQGAGRDLVFLWDNPTSEFSDPAHLREVAGFFLRRAGQPVQVHVPLLPRDIDPFPRLIALAGAYPDSALIWAYDEYVPRTRGIKFPAHPDRFADWQCRNFGRQTITVLACVRKDQRGAT